MRTMHCRIATHVALLSAALALAAAPSPASADDGPVRMARADQAFDEGKQYLAQHDYLRACPLFEESYALDPASGSLLALAICHERQGKLATAVREYDQLVVRSEREGRRDRAQAARDRSAALLPRLSTLTIATVGEPHALEVRINGAPIDPAELGRPLPVDGGQQRVEASAPGKRPWSVQVAVAEQNDRRTVIIPRLLALGESEVDLQVERPTPMPRRFVRPAAPQPQRPEPLESPGLSGTQWTGIAAMGLALGGFAATGYFAYIAHEQEVDSRPLCNVDLCTAEGRELRLDARDAGNAATAALAGGAALTALGVALVVWGAPDDEEHRPEPRKLSARPWAAPSGAGAELRGSF